MQMLKIEDVHMISSNMAAGNAVIKVNNFRHKAELVFYLQGGNCVGVRLGRHDQKLKTKNLEAFLNAHKMDIRKQAAQEICNLKNENTQKKVLSKSA